jgi:hypothetical protein
MLKPGTDDGRPLPLDAGCPVHGLAAAAEKRGREDARVDTEGDIVDKAVEPELRKD